VEMLTVCPRDKHIVPVSVSLAKLEACCFPANVGESNPVPTRSVVKETCAENVHDDSYALRLRNVFSAAALADSEITQKLTKMSAP
jgi:hypothetical protein